MLHEVCNAMFLEPRTSPAARARAAIDPLVSFVIPIRDDARRLARCLESIHANEYQPDRIEIIVVDNGSQDDSAAVARSFGAAVIEEARGRVGELRNLGARHAHGQILAFVDADHELDSGWIKAAVDKLSQPGVGGAGDLCHAPRGGTWVQRTYDGFRSRQPASDDVEWLGSGNLAIRRELFETLGGFDRRLTTCEDVDLCRRLRASGYRLVRDARLYSEHFGDPATLRQLFRGELWRGRDNFKAALLGGVSSRSLPSLVIPVVDLACLIGIAASAVSPRSTGVFLLVGAASTVLALASARTVRILHNMRQRGLAAVARAFVVALVYDVARALALVLRRRYHRPGPKAAGPLVVVSTPQMTGGGTAQSVLSRGDPRAGDAIRVLELRSVRGTGGGPEKTILLGAARSNGSGVKVTVCYLRDRRDPDFRIDSRARAMGIDYVEIGERHSFDPSIWPALKRLVVEQGIDIVHAHDYKTNLLALLLAWRTGVLPVTTAHGWAGTSWREHVYYFFDRRLIARFPVAIAVSDTIRRTLIAHGARPERVHRIRNGIDSSFFTRDPVARHQLRARLAIPPDAVVVGSVGRLERVKRFDHLLRAAAAIHPRPFVLIAGDGRCRASLVNLAVSLGLAGRMKWLGHREDVRDVHQALDVFVQSSDSEGFPNAVLEAMAVETPVVATDVGGTRELIEAGVHGLLVTPGDVTALSGAIAETLARPQETARRVREARTKVESELSFEARTAEVERLYLQLMSEQARAEVEQVARDNGRQQMEAADRSPGEGADTRFAGLSRRPRRRLSGV